MNSSKEQGQNPYEITSKINSLSKQMIARSNKSPNGIATIVETKPEPPQRIINNQPNAKIKLITSTSKPISTSHTHCWPNYTEEIREQFAEQTKANYRKATHKLRNENINPAMYIFHSSVKNRIDREVKWRYQQCVKQYEPVGQQSSTIVDQINLIPPPMNLWDQPPHRNKLSFLALRLHNKMESSTQNFGNNRT